MNEEEWLACANPQLMLPVCVGISERKQRLLAAACCRRVEAFLEPFTPSFPVNFLAAIERHADAPLPGAELGLIAREAGYAYSVSTIDGAAESAVHCALMTPIRLAGCLECAARAGDDAEQQAVLVRDIFGNPFRPVTFAPAWRTSDVLALAKGIYDERAFDRMPILADALQDAGCTNDDILNHCRDTSTLHARGCWVVDLVLGKS